MHDTKSAVTKKVNQLKDKPRRPAAWVPYVKLEVCTAESHPIMTFSSSTERALDHWVSPSTWDSLNHTDTAKFYEFVSQYHKDHGSAMDECAMRDRIKEVVMAKGHPFGRLEADFVHKCVSVARNVLDILSVDKSIVIRSFQSAAAASTSGAPAGIAGRAEKNSAAPRIIHFTQTSV